MKIATRNRVGNTSFHMVLKTFVSRMNCCYDFIRIHDSPVNYSYSHPRIYSFNRQQRTRGPKMFLFHLMNFIFLLEECESYTGERSYFNMQKVIFQREKIRRECFWPVNVHDFSMQKLLSRQRIICFHTAEFCATYWMILFPRLNLSIRTAEF